MSWIKDRYRREETGAGEEARASCSWLPAGYALDESDPDVVILRRPDGSFSAAFAVMGATREGILNAVEEDLRRDSGASEGAGRSRNGASVVIEPRR